MRAIAVLSVVAFHAFPNWVRGGFVGVDIFFVISGYLISTIILGNLEAGRFTLSDFYARRIRRIFPALVLVMACTLVFGWVALPAEDYARLGTHVSAGAAFVSNLVLFRESGYFDVEAESKLMLHLWSLAIEEQFYILWPLALAAFWQRGKGFLAVVTLAALASFGASLWFSVKEPSAAFYWPVTRFWELMIGGALAYVSMHRSDLLVRYAQVRAVLGLLLVLCAIFLIDKTQAFPGWRALIPTIGAFLLISGGAHSAVNRHLLAARPMVWVGLISYPLYLWHWPILSAPHLLYGDGFSVTGRVFAVICACLLATATYHLVEKGVRHRPGRTAVIQLSGLMAVVFVFGLVLSVCEGFPGRTRDSIKVLYEGEIGHVQFHDHLKSTYAPCQPPGLHASAPDWNGMKRCFQSKGSSAVSVALIGDSHAEHLFPGLAEAMRGENIAYYIVDPNHGLPFVSNPRFGAIFDRVLGDENIHTVVLAAYWSARLKSLIVKGSVEREIDATLARLRSNGKRVVLLGNVPDFGFAVKRCKYEGLFGGNVCSESSLLFEGAKALYEPDFIAASRRRGAQYLDLSAFLCSDRTCSMADGGRLLYRDKNHLGLEGSRHVGARLAAAVAPAPR